MRKGKKMFKQLAVVPLLLCVALGSSAVAVAEEEMTFEQIMQSAAGQPIRARIDEGVVHSINLSTRTGIIGGHKYHFGPAFSESPLKVTLYNSEAGALELLQPGMKVEVTYGDFGMSRVAVVIRQLADDADIEH